MSELPAALLSRWSTLWGDDRVAEHVATDVASLPVSFRVHRLRGDADASLAELTALGLTPTPVTGVPDGWQVPATQRDLLTRAAPATDGRVYVQGASSWLPVLLLDVLPGQEVLDLCAAPGGKSLHLADRMEGRGRLACVEVVRDRFFRLRANLQRGGVAHAALYMKDGRSVGGAVPGRFDRVLLDAPCSSEAGIDPADPTTWEHWSERKVRECARKQHGLIRSAWLALKPGGTLVYSTCTFAPEENEVIVDGLLRDAPDAELVPIVWDHAPTEPGLTAWDGDTLDPRLAHTLRVRPHGVWEGFYCAVLRKPA